MVVSSPEPAQVGKLEWWSHLNKCTFALHTGSAFLAEAKVAYAHRTLIESRDHPVNPVQILSPWLVQCLLVLWSHSENIHQPLRGTFAPRQKIFIFKGTINNFFFNFFIKFKFSELLRN
jgi:hypothetical protein